MQVRTTLKLYATRHELGGWVELARKQPYIVNVSVYVDGSVAISKNSQVDFFRVEFEVHGLQDSRDFIDKLERHKNGEEKQERGF